MHFGARAGVRPEMISRGQRVVQRCRCPFVEASGEKGHIAADETQSADLRRGVRPCGDAAENEPGKYGQYDATFHAVCHCAAPRGFRRTPKDRSSYLMEELRKDARGDPYGSPRTALTVDRTLGPGGPCFSFREGICGRIRSRICAVSSYTMTMTPTTTATTTRPISNSKSISDSFPARIAMRHVTFLCGRARNRMFMARGEDRTA